MVCTAPPWPYVSELRLCHTASARARALALPAQQRHRYAGAKHPAGAAACALHRGALDCQECGACCRHAYDIVEVARREIVTVRHPQLVEQKGRLLQLRRSADRLRCAALAGPPEGPYGCTIYADRPNTCREFTAGTSSCVTARRWVGLECGSCP